MATLRDGKLALEPGEAFAVIVVGRKVAGRSPEVDVRIALDESSTPAAPDAVRAALMPLLTVVGG
mgnify:FL=1